MKKYFFITKHQIESNAYNQPIFHIKGKGIIMQKIRPDMDIGHNISYLRQRAGLTQD